MKSVLHRPRLLDLFCGAGGAGMGYARAGFDVTGVDLAEQPDYPFLFIQADALAFVARNARFFDVIHASPPCQAHSSLRALGGQPEHEDLIPATRGLLRASGKPYIIENVPRAPLIRPVVLCGEYFGLRVRRHRLFESNLSLWSPACHMHHRRKGTIGVYGDHPQISKGMNRAHTLAEAQQAMGIDWMTWPELCEAIPPAYTHHIGRQVIKHLEMAA